MVPQSPARFGFVLGPLLVVAACASDCPQGNQSQAVLHLANGTSAAGEVRASTQPGVLRWQAASSGSASEFAWNEVSSIVWPSTAGALKPTGEFCFELAAGDRLFGSLVSLGDSRAEIDVPRLGRIHVERSSIYRICPSRDGTDLIYLGPHGLLGWHEPAGENDWREDWGRPTTDRQHASIRGDFGLPDRASIEFEISWKSRPDFVFALGVDDPVKAVERAFRFEVWGTDLIVHRELEDQEDLEILQEVSRGAGHIHLQAYLDQKKGRILVFSAGAKPLADLKVRETTPSTLPGLALATSRGDVRLERLRISQWDGENPGGVRVDQTRIRLADGSISYGQLIGFHASAREFLFKTAAGASRVPENRVSSLLFSVPRAEPPRMLRAVYHDGSRVSGELVKMDDGVLGFTVPGIQEVLRLPLSGLQSLVNLRHETRRPRQQ